MLHEDFIEIDQNKRLYNMAHYTNETFNTYQ